MPNLLEDAIIVAADAHRGQLDKAGKPYILHPLRVMLTVATNGNPEHVQAAAVLHDVLEDTHLTVDWLRRRFPVEVVALVHRLTRDPATTTYFKYIERVAKDPDATTIKWADLFDNLSRLPIPGHEDASEGLLKRYQKAMVILRGSDNALG